MNHESTVSKVEIEGRTYYVETHDWNYTDGIIKLHDAMEHRKSIPKEIQILCPMNLIISEVGRPDWMERKEQT